VTKESLNDALNQIEFNQNLILQRASARYQLILSVLITLFAFFLGLALQGNKYAPILAVVTAISTIVAYVAFEREFENRQADIGTTFESVNAMKEVINNSKNQ